MATDEVGRGWIFLMANVELSHLRWWTRVAYFAVVAKYTRGHSKMPRWWSSKGKIVALIAGCLVDYNILEDGIDICCCNGGLWQ